MTETNFLKTCIITGILFFKQNLKSNAFQISIYNKNSLRLFYARNGPKKTLRHQITIIECHVFFVDTGIKKLKNHQHLQNCITANIRIYCTCRARYFASVATSIHQSFFYTVFSCSVRHKLCAITCNEKHDQSVVVEL